MKKYANLHSHSTHSDGVYTPEELVRIAKDEGYSALAITDHDVATAYPELKAACDKVGMEAIFGCEFTGYSDEFKFEFHITAYNFDPEYPEMKEYLRKCSETTTHITRVLFERGREEGLISKEVTWDDVLEYNKGITWLCNDHVFRTYKARGLMTDLEYDNFFNTVYGKRRGEVPKLHKKLPLPELVALIKRAGGIALVAHPHGKLHAIPRLMELGISGLEVWHSMLTPDEVVEALKIARDNRLFISGGSDHEGLLGGQYQFYEHPEKTQFWLPEGYAGTTKEFFDEIKNREFMPDREKYIDKCIEECSLRS